MSSELTLVSQLAIILIAAGFFTIISKALKQPLILGYIIAGFIVGPSLGLFPQFSPESVHDWSELGIIFLLFGLGLEFSFKKLLNVGSAAIITAVTICIGMFFIGLLTGLALQWSTMESFFLGGMMGMSSTTIIIKAYDDLGIKNKPYASLVFGILVVEDLLAVLVMVLFSTIAVSNRFSGTELLISLVKLVSFLVFWFLVGIYVLPQLFKKARKYINDEILLLISVGLCFTMVLLANHAGFSSALGAFIMGSILSSTVEGENIEKLIVNIKNLFGAIFFVSVGMMVNPAVIAAQWSTILILTLVAMTGILFFSTGGSLLAGKSLDTAVHIGFSLPQLGEFSFIIAGLGLSLGVLSDFIYPTIIAVSVITTFTTPYMIKAADPVSSWLHRKLPAKVLDAISKRSAQASGNSKAEDNLWKTFIKKYLLRIGIYFIILMALGLAIKTYMPKLGEMFLPGLNDRWRTIIEIAVSLTIMFPFLYGLGINSGDLRTLAQTLIRKNPKARIPIFASIILRLFLAVDFAVATIMLFVDIPKWNMLIILAGLFIIFIIARLTAKRHTSIEDRFMANLNEKENLQRSMAPVATTINQTLSEYDVNVEKVSISSDFDLAGCKLKDLPFRRESGVNIVKIIRGSHSIVIPGGDECIFPGDTIVVVGTTAQLNEFRSQMANHTVKCKEKIDDFVIYPLTLTKRSLLAGKELKDTNMRASGCMVISIKRNDDLITNPPYDFVFEPGDVLYLAGLKSSLEWMGR